jgi:hypothetical protein
MGQVKQAILELEDFVAGCLREGRTLNQTIRDEVLTKISNAEENLKTLSKHFDNSVDDDDIPF